ncbi:hypothetical protein BRCON_1496 [Candidatus Sumerlaea chitinivorans]|uniref:Uncharacterized protein n=1 Tax=Sumerlaea chitinivorans TaxID=2250252 RepID=A0A2Z4Y713_SUMC1|nr:hypothetical protein BRCON_1496 [Candidatus Sumerlaea chitinivorans]
MEAQTSSLDSVLFEHIVVFFARSNRFVLALNWLQEKDPVGLSVN